MSELIPVKTAREIERMREAARHVGEILVLLRERVHPGVTTAELDACAAHEIERRGVTSSFRGYAPHGMPPFPAVACISVNDEVVHGIPGPRELEDGDVVSLDFGVESHGFHADSAVTLPVGEIDKSTTELLTTTHEALHAGIEQMLPGNRLGDISAAVQRRSERGPHTVVRQFVGHGIGRALHEAPQIPNHGEAGTGPELRPGMTFAVEPMVSAGSPAVRMLDDGWTAVTADGARSAHFEHTVLITEHGPEVLTRVEGSH